MHLFLEVFSGMTYMYCVGTPQIASRSSQVWVCIVVYVILSATLVYEIPGHLFTVVSVAALKKCCIACAVVQLLLHSDEQILPQSSFCFTRVVSPCHTK